MNTTHRVCVLAAIAGTALGAALFAPHVAQPQAYHAFADARPLLGVPNAADSLSNLGFVAAGALGLAFVSRRQAPRGAYLAFFAAVILTGFGSAYYHLAPDDSRLVWDRLPMTLAFASLLAAEIGGRIDRRAGDLLLLPLLVVGIGTVAYWRFSSVLEVENLAPYLAFQFGAVALLIAIAALFPSGGTGNALFWVVVAYAAAKLFEVYDEEIYGIGRWISGHTLKHLAAAAGALLLAHHLRASREAKNHAS